MITGATQTCFKFLQQHIAIPDNLALDYNPQALAHAKKPIRILWAHYAHDQPIYLNTDWHRITHIVCVSNWQRQQFLQHFDIPEDKISVIPNGVADYFTPTYPKTKTLIYASAPYRGLKYIKYIFSRVQQHHPDATLKIFTGMSLHGGEDTPEQLAIYQDLRATPGVIFSQPIAHEQLAREFSTAAVLCYPNNWEETSCVTLLEAMASGCIPVTSDIGALPETAHGHGVQVPMRGIYTNSGWQVTRQFLDDFSQAVTTVLNNYSYNQCETVANYSRTQHSWDKLAQQWKELFETLSQRNINDSKSINSNFSTAIWRTHSSRSQGLGTCIQ
jgi:glycosyltransferase involved in cell wall biosynthesis